MGVPATNAFDFELRSSDLELVSFVFNNISGCTYIS